MPLYSELLPDELDALWQMGAPAIVPWGVIADGFAAELAQRVGGVLFPTVWLSMATAEERPLLSIRIEAFRTVLDDLLEGLYLSGAWKVCLVTGQVDSSQRVEMTEAALRAMDDYEELLVFCGMEHDFHAEEVSRSVEVWDFWIRSAGVGELEDHYKEVFDREEKSG